MKPEKSLSAETMAGTILLRNQVVRTREGRKYVVNKEHPLPEGASVVADTPHGDGDFSYVCGMDWCRCME